MNFKTVGIIGKYGQQNIESTLLELHQILQSLVSKVFVDRKTVDRYPGHNLEPLSTNELGEQSDLIIVIGGDGTFLQAARDVVQWHKPMLGVNLGRLGFLTDITPDKDMKLNLQKILNGEYISENRNLLVSNICRDDKIIKTVLALNDIVIHKWEAARMIEFETRINNNFVNIQRADGIIISTPTGSTAYSLAAGGPILEPDLESFALVSICPHSMNNRPIVIRSSSKIEIELAKTSSSKAQLTYDGQTACDILIGDIVKIQRHPEKITLIHSIDYEPYSTWRKKLHWAKAPY